MRLSDIASVEQSTRNSRSAAWFNRQPSVLLIITKQGDANVIETVDNIRALIPEIKRWIPADIDISILSDRTGTIRASVADMQLTLAGTIALVMLVVFLFLRRATPTLAAGVTVPLSLAGTCALMWCVGFSIDNLSLMALAVSVGFVVDDAIVMIENVFRNMEKGHSPLRATIEGARQIGFTVISISVSLVAAFIPLLFMGGIVGRAFREFSVTLAFAILISTIVSLTVTPMICAHYIRSVPSRTETRFDRIVEWVLSRLIRAYGASLRVLLEHRVLMLVVMAATIALTVDLYIKTPKGFFPQDDTGLIFTSTRAAPDISYKAMVDMQLKALDIILADPAVAGVGSSVGGSAWSASVNQGRMFVSLKPLAERDNIPTAARDRPAAPEIRAHSRHRGVDVPGAGRARRRPLGPLAVPVHAVELRSRRAAEMGAARGRAGEDRAGRGRRVDRPRAGRLPAQRLDRPAGRRAARRAHPGHRCGARQRLCAAAGVDDLHPAQPVSRDPRGRSAVPARSERSVAHLRQRHAAARRFRSPTWRASSAASRRW